MEVNLGSHHAMNLMAILKHRSNLRRVFALQSGLTAR